MKMKDTLGGIFEQIKTSLLRWRQQGQFSVALFTIMAVLIIGVLWLLLSHPAKKPLPPAPSKVTQSKSEDYLICVASQQMSTGYTEPSWGPPASSTKGYQIGTVAVHPRIATQWSGDPRDPIIPFGTTIHLLNPSAVKVNGKWYDSLMVNDTGDVNLGLWSAYPYWFDIYFGSTEYWSTTAARAYGTHKIDYYWVEKWKKSS
jgi:hypothetical protein